MSLHSKKDIFITLLVSDNKAIHLVCMKVKYFSEEILPIINTKRSFINDFDRRALVYTGEQTFWNYKENFSLGGQARL